MKTVMDRIGMVSSFVGRQTWRNVFNVAGMQRERLSGRYEPAQ